MSTTMTFYGVDIETPPGISMPVDEEGRLTADTSITYTINPPEYRAISAHVVILENGTPLTCIPGEPQGRESTVISKEKVLTNPLHLFKLTY